jgi:hypothetical protein
MASMEAHDWWADVQEDREALAGSSRRRRPVSVWTDDDLDLIPERVVARPWVSDELDAGRSAAASRDARLARLRAVERGQDLDRRGRSERLAADPVGRRAADDAPAGRRRAPVEDWLADEAPRAAAPLQLLEDDSRYDDAPDEPRRARPATTDADATPAADAFEWGRDPGAADVPRGPHPVRRLVQAIAEPQPRGEEADGQRTVRITGDASAATAPVPAARQQLARAATRRPPRSAREALTHQPDRLALYAVLLGFVLIALAFASSDASAATAAL